MALTQRDRRALMILGIAAPILAVVFYGEAMISALGADSPEYRQANARFDAVYGSMKKFDLWSSQAAALQKKLHVEVNPVSADEQKDSFLKALEDQGLKREVKITAHRWLVTRGAARSEIQRRAFQIDCSGKFPNLIEFVRGIEEMTIPVVIDEISLSRLSGKGNEQQLKATLQLHIYVFPEGGADGQA